MYTYMFIYILWALNLTQNVHYMGPVHLSVPLTLPTRTLCGTPIRTYKHTFKGLKPTGPTHSPTHPTQLPARAVHPTYKPTCKFLYMSSRKSQSSSRANEGRHSRTNRSKEQQKMCQPPNFNIFQILSKIICILIL